MAKAAGERFTKKERSWILYDWANSVYATNIMAAIFPAIFVNVAGKHGDLWWGYGTSIATFLVAIAAPILGAIGDFKGMKKKMFSVFVWLGVIFTALIAVTNDWRVMLIGYVISHIGFSGANLYYDSFLTDVTTNERMDKVSSWGYAMGYIGGSTIPFIMSILMLQFLGAANPIAQKFAILITSAWWLVFTIPFLKNVEQEHYIERHEFTVANTFRNIFRTAKDIATQRGLMMFVLAYFFYIDGVGTIISISTAYGAALGLGMMSMILALLVTQFVAMPFSILFGKLAGKITTRRALMLAIVVYMFICVVGFTMGFTLEPDQKAFERAYSGQIRAEEYRLMDEQGINENSDAHAVLERYVIALQSYVARGEVTTDAFDEAQPTVSELPADMAAKVTAIAQPLKDAVKTFNDSDQTIAPYHQAIKRSTMFFWSMAILVGTVQGGIQAMSRSYFGKLVPKHRSSEFFGFFDIFGKFAAVMGPAIYGIVGSLTGRSSYGALCLMVLFAIGLAFLILGQKDMIKMEQQNLAEEANA